VRSWVSRVDLTSSVVLACEVFLFIVFGWGGLWCVVDCLVSDGSGGWVAGCVVAFVRCGCFWLAFCVWLLELDCCGLAHCLELLFWGWVLVLLPVVFAGCSDCLVCVFVSGCVYSSLWLLLVGLIGFVTSFLWRCRQLVWTAPGAVGTALSSQTWGIPCPWL